MTAVRYRGVFDDPADGPAEAVEGDSVIDELAQLLAIVGVG
jgi:hypothetical protein